MRVAFPPRLLDRDSNGGSAVLHQLTPAGWPVAATLARRARAWQQSERAAVAYAAHLKSAVQDFR